MSAEKSVLTVFSCEADDTLGRGYELFNRVLRALRISSVAVGWNLKSADPLSRLFGSLWLLHSSGSQPHNL